jgi:hypothetical protein
MLLKCLSPLKLTIAWVYMIENFGDYMYLMRVILYVPPSLIIIINIEDYVPPPVHTLWAACSFISANSAAESLNLLVTVYFYRKWQVYLYRPGTHFSSSQATATVTVQAFFVFRICRRRSPYFCLLLLWHICAVSGDKMWMVLAWVCIVDWWLFDQWWLTVATPLLQAPLAIFQIVAAFSEIFTIGRNSTLLTG